MTNKNSGLWPGTLVVDQVAWIGSGTR